MSEDQFAEIVEAIGRVNEDGVEHFTTPVTIRCDDVEGEGELDYCATAKRVDRRLTAIEFRAIAIRVSDKRLITAAYEAGYQIIDGTIEATAARLFASDWPEGVERATRGYIDGLAPTIVELVRSEQRTAGADVARQGTTGIDIMRAAALPFRDDVELEIGGHSHGATSVTGEWSFHVREWGFKQVYLTLHTITPREPLALALSETTPGSFLLTGRQDVIAHVPAFWAENALHVCVRGVELQHRRRPETSKIYSFRSRTTALHENELRPYIYGFVPAVPMSEIVELLETERDPHVAAQAAYLAGKHEITVAVQALIGCLIDPIEASEVVNNALWAVAELKATAAIPAIQRLVATVGASAIAALVAIDPVGTLAWLEAQRGDLGATCAAYLEAHPAIAGAADAPLDLTHAGVALTGYPHSAAVDPTGRYFAVGLQNTVLLGECAHPENASELVTSGPNIDALAFNPGGMTLVVANVARALELWDPLTRQLVRTLPNQEGLDQLQLSPDGTQLAGGCAFGGVWVWDLAAGASRSPTRPKGVRDIAWPSWSATGDLFAATKTKIVRWSRGHGTGEVIAKGRELYRMVVVPEVSVIAAASRENRIQLWRLDGAPLGELLGHDQQILQLASARGLLATGDRGGRVVVWDVAGRKELGHVQAHEGRVAALAFSADGNWLVSAGIDDRRVEIWATRALASSR